MGWVGVAVSTGVTGVGDVDGTGVRVAVTAVVTGDPPVEGVSCSGKTGGVSVGNDGALRVGSGIAGSLVGSGTVVAAVVVGVESGVAKIGNVALVTVVGRAVVVGVLEAATDSVAVARDT